MDVVRSEIMTLGGRVEVATRAGSGTTFHLYLPLTLAVAQAVMVRAGGRLWALPAPMVEHVQHVKADALGRHVRAAPRRARGPELLVPLPAALARRSEPDSGSSRNNPVLLLRSGQNVAAIHVDEMIGNQEVVVKNIGPQLARVSGIAGATVLGNGEVVLIINPVQLAQRADVPGVRPQCRARRARSSEARRRAGRSSARDDRRRLADGAQDHEQAPDARRFRSAHRRATASTRWRSSRRRCRT
jgi:chemosensory pili system protein ChpA (sensor histidine kinase/response regulator)